MVPTNSGHLMEVSLRLRMEASLTAGSLSLHVREQKDQYPAPASPWGYCGLRDWSRQREVPAAATRPRNWPPVPSSLRILKFTVRLCQMLILVHGPACLERIGGHDHIEQAETVILGSKDSDPF